MRGSGVERILNDYPACTDRPRTVMRGKSRNRRAMAQEKEERGGKICALPRILAACPAGHRGRPEGQGESQEGV